MKTILTALIGIFLFAASAFAQYVVYKTTDGVVLLSKTEGQYFTIDVPGAKILPVDPDNAPHPYLMVDGRFLQVVVVALNDFKGDISKDDGTLLKSYLEYEKDFWKTKTTGFYSDPVKLPSGHAALTWSYSLSPELKQQEIEKGNTPSRSNEMLSFHSNKYVVTLGSDVEGADTQEAVRKFLLKVASSFYASDHPITLKFLHDGSYKRE